MNVVELNSKDLQKYLIQIVDDADFILRKTGSFAVDRRLYSFESTDSIEQQDLNSERTYWILFGNYRISSLQPIVERLGNHSKLCLVMPNDDTSLFLSSFEQGLLESWLEKSKIELIFGANSDACAKKLSNSMDRLSFNGWKPLIDGKYLEDHPAESEQFFRVLGEILNQEIIIENTFGVATKIFFENSLINLPLAISSSKFSLAAKHYDGRPVLLVTPGPSLTKQLPAIRKHKDVYTIICVSVSYSILMDEGIEPDYVVSLDRLNPPVLRPDSKSKLITDLGSDPRTAWSSPSQTIFNSHHHNIHDLLSRVGVEIDHLRTGGNVATSAFCFARQLHASVLVMVGADLSFAADGRRHAEGNTLSTPTKDLAFQIPGYYGEKVVTSHDMLLYKKWFEKVLPGLPDIVVFNATEGGAYIEGASNVSFEAISNELQKFKIDKIEWSLPENPNPSSAQVRNLIEGVDALITLVSLYLDLAEKGTSACLEYQSGNDEIDFSFIDEVSHQLGEFPEYLKFCVNIYAGREMKKHQIFMARNSEKLLSNSEIINYYARVFGVTAKAATSARDFLIKSKSFYESLLENPNINHPDQKVLSLINQFSRI